MVTFRLVDRRGGDACGDQTLEPGRGLLGQAPELRVERHVEAVPGLAIEESAGRYGRRQHLLQTKSLGAELHLVSPVTLRPAAFVLDWKGPPCALADPVKLDDVGLAGEPVAEATERKRPGDPEIAAGFLNTAVRLLMKMPAFDGQRILYPHLLQMDQRALPLAKQQVLESGKREEVVFGEHWSHRISRRLTPTGKRSRATVTS